MHILSSVLMWLICPLKIMWIIILVASLRLFPAHGLSIRADTTLIILPNTDRFGLNTFAILQCIIEPGNSTVISRWILPNGSIVTSTNLNERIAMDQGPLVRANGIIEFGTVLVIQSISYRDAGLYTCETTAITTSESTSITECPLWPVSDASELQLNAILQAAEETVVTYDTATEIELTCEMAGFIRPDEDLQWFKIDGILSSNVGERYTVTYREGQQPNGAQDGGNETVPSRLSVLTISLPQESDSGTFVCRLNETATSAEIHLTVLSELPSPTSPSHSVQVGQPLPTALCPVTTSDKQGPLTCAQIIGIAVGGTFVATAVLSVILMATAMKLWQKRQPSNKAFVPALLPLKT